MADVPRWRRYLRFWRSNVAADVDDEFRFHVQERIDDLVARGLTPAQAIEAATRRAAMFLGAEDLGTLEPTKWADFVVLDANPLTDIRNSRRIRAVYIAGAEANEGR